VCGGIKGSANLVKDSASIAAGWQLLDCGLLAGNEWHYRPVYEIPSPTQNALAVGEKGCHVLSSLR
jgi:hypothetical protein